MESCFPVQMGVKFEMNRVETDFLPYIRRGRWTRTLSSADCRQIFGKNPDMKCKFCFLCKYYGKDAKICASDDIAWKHCSAYSEFEVIIAIKERFTELPGIGP